MEMCKQQRFQQVSESSFIAIGKKLHITHGSERLFHAAGLAIKEKPQQQHANINYLKNFMHFTMKNECFLTFIIRCQMIKNK